MPRDARAGHVVLVAGSDTLLVQQAELDQRVSQGNGMSEGRG